MCSGYSNKTRGPGPEVVDEYGDKPFLDRSFYDQKPKRISKKGFLKFY